MLIIYVSPTLFHASKPGNTVCDVCSIAYFNVFGVDLIFDMLNDVSLAEKLELLQIY